MRLKGFNSILKFLKYNDIIHLLRMSNNKSIEN